MLLAKVSSCVEIPQENPSEPAEIQASRRREGFSLQQMARNMVGNGPPVFPGHDVLRPSAKGHKLKPAMRTKCRGPRPSDYIRATPEAALAEKVWDLAIKMAADNELYHRVFTKIFEGQWKGEYRVNNYLGPVHDALFPSGRQFDHPPQRLPWEHNHLGLACSFVRSARGHGVANQILETNYTEHTWSNVQHFFDAMGMTQKFGKYLGLVMSYGLSAMWDLGISPAMKVFEGQPIGDAFSYDVDQFQNYDIEGARFGYEVIGSDTRDRE